MNNLFLRKAEYSDMDLLYVWANDPVVRENSFKTDAIPYDNHVKWFNKMMEDESVLQFILMNNNTPVGQIRLNVDKDVAEIGYSIAKEYRGKGYGHRIIQLVSSIVNKQYPDIKKLVAKVKPNNIDSNRIFLNEGFDLEYSCYVLNVGECKEKNDTE